MTTFWQNYDIFSIQFDPIYKFFFDELMKFSMNDVFNMYFQKVNFFWD